MKIFFKVWLPIILVVVGAFYITSKFIQPPVEKKLVIASGGEKGHYYKTALEYKKLLEDEGVKVEIIKTAGSEENLRLLLDKKVDIAFIQNGIIHNGNKNKLYSLANVFYEPLWFFYRDTGFIKNYEVEFIGSKLSLGIEGSGTKFLSSLVLTLNGLNEANSDFLYLPTKESKDKLLSGEIDGMFFIGQAESGIVRSLLENPDIRLFSFSRAEAYAKNLPFLKSLNLYEGTLDMYANLPSEDIKLLGSTASLVTHEDVPDELVRFFVKQLPKVHGSGGLFDKIGEFPTIANMDTQIHDEAYMYFTHGDTWLETIFPYWVASNIDRLKILLIPLLTLLIPLFKGVIPLYVWTIRSKIYKWYDKVNEIDEKVNTASSEELKVIVKELEDLKMEIQNQTKVPLAYMGEYYNLLVHIDLVITKAKNHATGT
ncbi:MAG: TAXI family TRAP transporter solute-binding subunit [Arcobacteraceae bacterium]|jgi:TRAP transporter TAXI family solute receptor